MKKAWMSGLILAAGLAYAGAASADVKLGVAGPITGANAAFGAQLVNGVQQAVDDINAKGGVLGQKLTLETGDDVADPKQGVAVANKFVGDGVKFVVGHMQSGVTMAASDVYQDGGVLAITPSSTNPKITERGLWNVFRTCGRDDQQGSVAGDYILKNLKGKKVAFVHDKTTYGKGLVDETKKTINAGGVKEVLYEGVNAGEKDYSAIVSKIKDSGAEIVYWGGLYTEAGLIARQMHDQGVKAVIMSGDGLASNEYNAIGGDGVIGTLMTFSPDPRKRPEAAAIVKEFEAKNFNPETYTLYSYAAVQIIAQAAEAAKSAEPEKVAEKMHSGMVFHTAIGDISYDKNGDITRPDYTVYTWKKGDDGKITYFQND